MIRREYKNGWVIFTQFEHSKLSGEIMEYWGNNEFTSIEPRDNVNYAINYHDMGWVYWDENPRINPENNYPASFTDMYPSEQHSIWAKCFENYPGNYSYASALVALHFNKFNNHLLDKDPSDAGSLEFKKRIISSVAKSLKIDPGLIEKDLPPQLYTNLKYLQIGDILSLAICHGWKSTELKDSPVDYNGLKVDLRLTSGDGVNFKVEPYPFSEEKLNLQIRGRILLKKTFESDEDLRSEIKKAEIQNFYFTIKN